MANKTLPRHLTRRRLITGAASTGVALIAAPALLRSASAQSWLPGNPFSLGVASGAPRSDGFVLWTRLAPEPMSTNPETPGGMRGGDVAVDYEIATDPAMHDVVRKGEATAERAFAYSVHLDVSGLEPGRPYWYRFMSGDATSGVGRAVTLPAAGAPLDKLRFGFVSCSNYEHGYFSAYRHLTDENPEFVLFLGDYIYDTIEENQPTVRRHSDGVPSDDAADLSQPLCAIPARSRPAKPARAGAGAGHLGRPRGQNDYADQWSQWFVEPARFLLQRAAAYQAFYEHMPVRPILSRPQGPVMRVYDRFSFGDLIEISMIDGRQYRSREACYGPPNKGGGHLESNASCPERLAAGRTMMGFAQESWLYSGAGALEGAVEFDRPGRADGAIPGKAGRRRRVLDRRLGRLPGQSHAAPQAHRRHQRGQSRGDRRRHPCVFRQRPAARFRRPGFAGGGDRIRRHVDLILSARPTSCSRRRCPTIRTFVSSKAGGAAMSASISNARTCRCACACVSDAHDPKADIATLKTFAVESGRAGVVEA